MSLQPDHSADYSYRQAQYAVRHSFNKSTAYSVFSIANSNRIAQVEFSRLPRGLQDLQLSGTSDSME